MGPFKMYIPPYGTQTDVTVITAILVSRALMPALQISH